MNCTYKQTRGLKGAGSSFPESSPLAIFDAAATGNNSQHSAMTQIRHVNEEKAQRIYLQQASMY